MAELINLKNGKIDLKFHATPKKFARVEKLNYRGKFFKVYVDKNDSLYDIKLCTVLSWKSIEKGGKKISIPDEVSEVRDAKLFNMLKGNPYKIAARKVMAEIDYQFMD